MERMGELTAAVGPFPVFLGVDGEFDTLSHIIRRRFDTGVLGSSLAKPSASLPCNRPDCKAFRFLAVDSAIFFRPCRGVACSFIFILDSGLDSSFCWRRGLFLTVLVLAWTVDEADAEERSMLFEL